MIRVCASIIPVGFHASRAPVEGARFTSSSLQVHLDVTRFIRPRTTTLAARAPAFTFAEPQFTKQAYSLAAKAPVLGSLNCGIAWQSGLVETSLLPVRRTPMYLETPKIAQASILSPSSPIAGRLLHSFLAPLSLLLGRQTHSQTHGRVPTYRS